MLPINANADILGFSRTMFSNFKPVIFLLLAVFIGIWLLDIFIGKFNDWVRSPTRTSTNVERNEIYTLVRIGKTRGFNLDAKKIMSSYNKAQEGILLTKLAKKYGVSLGSSKAENVKIKVIEK